jgi:hypothetical protein
LEKVKRGKKERFFIIGNAYESSSIGQKNVRSLQGGKTERNALCGVLCQKTQATTRVEHSSLAHFFVAGSGA